MVQVSETFVDTNNDMADGFGLIDSLGTLGTH